MCSYKTLFCSTGVCQQNFSSVTIVSSPAGTPVSGSTNTFEYPILSSVTLMCITSPLPSPSATFQWNVGGCTTCFPNGQMIQNITESNLTLEDAGNFTCTATDGSTPNTSEVFTLRISCKL